MFAGLVSFAALSTKLDPEDMRLMLRLSQICRGDGRPQFDGLVGKYIGEGVLTYFSYPQAHEDAESAAGLAKSPSRYVSASRPA
jgi:class 3 adenylate cyclase